MSIMEAVDEIRAELETGMALAKCQQCGCLAETLGNLAAALPAVGTLEATGLARRVTTWRRQLLPIAYDCLGCAHCYPAVAQNIFTQTYPAIDLAQAPLCEDRGREAIWPPVVGEYVVLDAAGPVAVSTLASTDLAEALALREPAGLAIVGKTETENIGVDKIIRNVITNPALQYLIVAGADSQGHQAGQTLLALASHGVDANGWVIGSRGKRPDLRNVSAAEIRAFRAQVEVVDMIGCQDVEAIGARIGELSALATPTAGTGAGDGTPVAITSAPEVQAQAPGRAVSLDEAGYFVILPLADKGVIYVEHYDYQNTLLRVITGSSARDIYSTLIGSGWVTELSHAAYLGKELTRAELSLRHGFKYTQDGA